jgi:hypothetical protein
MCTHSKPPLNISLIRAVKQLLSIGRQDAHTWTNNVSPEYLQIAILEDKWAVDIENGQGTVSSGGKGDEYGISNQYMSKMIQYLAEGNSYRIANPGPLGLYAFGYTTALLQVTSAAYLFLDYSSSLPVPRLF